MSENITTTGSIEDALDNLDPSVNEVEDCQNCKLPRSKMQTEKETKYRTREGVEIADAVVTRCAECGEQVDYSNLRGV